VSFLCLSSLISSDSLVSRSPGRIHHCMRSIGAAQNALDTMLRRVTDPERKTFGKFLYEHGQWSCKSLCRLPPS
jgi:hypothetical protein